MFVLALYCKLLKEAAVFFTFLLICFFARAQNPITIENSLPGNPSSEWDINGAGDLSIQGFATDISVNKGQTIHFKIKTNASSYTIKIYRLGYYQGNGARYIGDGVITATLPQLQPADLYDVATGLTDCSNWTESAHWDVPSTAVSGLYIAKLTRSTGASHIAFIVRDDASTSNLLFKTSDATWQAYNNYGGNSLYVNGSGTAVPGFNHATKVSYNRPFFTRNGGGGGGPEEDWLFNAEYPMIRWLERNGYDVSYTTDVDMSRSTTAITPASHKVLLSVGHDEYWSLNERSIFENARNAGVHLAFFSGNEVYWKVRWEDNYRTLVCYKEGNTGENVCNGECDPSNEWTGLWRNGCNATGANDGCKPENALTGQISWDGSSGAIKVPDAYKNLRFWRNTSVASLASGQTLTLPEGTLGYEWDWEQAAYASSYPAGRILMSSTTLNGHTHKLSLYRHSSGALVFGAGTVQWSWGLDANHDRGSTPASTDMQQATVNLFADMGVQPSTLQAGLMAAVSSTDNQAPVTTITTPAHGATVSNGNPVSITGTASDAGGVVAGIEISVDGGVTWQVASGTTNWSFTWTPSTNASVTIQSRGFDDTGNMETAGTAPSSNAVTITVGPGGTPVCPCTIFQPTNTPSNLNGNDNQPIELGVKFQTTTNGYITGIRFYKASGDNGTHIGHLWSSTGISLGQATFTAESASGWQQVNFGSPIAVTANTTYIASYHSSANFYTYSDNYFSTTVQNGPLKALASGEDGPNGVYIYSPTPAFPTQTFQSSNYWVDVVFETNVGPDGTPPTVSSTLPSGNATGVNINANINATFNEAIDASTVNSTNFELRNGSNLIPSTINYNAGSQTAVIDPTAPLSYSTVFTATIKGGATGVKDAAGNALANDFTWSFTTQSQTVITPPLPDPNTGPGGPILVISSTSNPFSRYAVEILRAEGLNEFSAMDISAVTASTLNSYDVVVLGEMALNAGNVSLLTNWVNEGGTLIAFKPDAQLFSLLGISSAGGTLVDKYLLVNTATGMPGTGIVGQTIQFHGPANLYSLNGATSLATLYSTATTATSNPAVTSNNVGTNGGKAVAFAYDLARSIIYTRQGNPLWAGQKRDGESGPIRSDDMFFPDWIDFNKVAIPQADEQQHLLANIIIQSNLHRKPLPRFWFLPRKLKAAVVMTGDDHANDGTTERFNQYLSLSPSNTSQAVSDWTAIRGTSYIYPNTPITNAEAVAFEAQGFEIALHLNTNCNNYTPASLESFFSTQLAAFASAFPGISSPVTHRTHCIAWSDWASKPKVELAHGIRLNTDYYYWPQAWVQDRPGMFTGSGMPMRFADLDGSIIDNYQVTTQLTDESGINYSNHITQLLDKAIGAEGYYGVFCANMHTDANGGNSTNGSNAIITAALARQIPVISAKQMLTWLDSRNSSSFGSVLWSNNTLNFSITPGAGANGLQAMVPVKGNSGQLSGLTRNGAAVAYTTEIIKGINYAFFDALSGNYAASYSAATAAPVISAMTTTSANGNVTINWTTDISSDSRVDYGTTANNLNLNQSNADMVTNHSVTLTGLTAGTTYYYRVTSSNGSAISATAPNPPADPLSFSVLASCASDQTLADFNLGTFDANTNPALETDGEVILKPVLIEEFSGSTVPAGWGQATFNSGGGTTVSNGSVTVNGTHIFSNTSFGPGSSVEYVATYTSASFQNVGFSTTQGFGEPWITIGQGASPDGNLYARASNNTNVNLGALLGSSHRFLIKWNTNNFEVYIDGSTIPAATIALTVTQPMFLQISDVNTSDGTLSVDWLRVAPYATAGSFTSRVFDASATTNWGAVTWTAAQPTGTGFQIQVRTGNTATPDGTWSNYTSVTNGGDIGMNSRYLQYRADLSTTDTKYTPALKDIVIECSQGSDITPPVITNIVATSAINGSSATITWTTNENANSRIDYGTSPGALTQNVSDATLITSHSLQLPGLAPGTTYYFRVTSNDAATNSATSPNPPAAPLSFVTLSPACFDDVTFADFSGGTAGTGTYISATQDGEVILKPAAGSEFSSLPPVTEWNSFSWGAGGTSAVSNGSLIVNGARYNSQPAAVTYSPGSSLEFIATFGASAFQHIGFGGGSDATTSNGIFTDLASPWAMFSTNNTTNTLQVRTMVPGGSVSNFIIPGGNNLIGVSHKYRIDWKTDGSFEYFVDDVSVRVEPIVITSGMRPAISDFNTSAPGIIVDWIRVSPYAVSGSFESRIYDAGAISTWGAATWNADIPTGTNLQLFQRQGNTPVPDANWTTFNPIGSNGSLISGSSQYIQYRADLSTTNNHVSPVLKDIHFSCSPTAVLVGTIGLQGRPAAPNPQWQVPLVISLYNGTTLVNTYNVTTNVNGQFTISGIMPGTYNISIKGFNTLRKVLLNQTISGGNNTINLGVQIAGDANGDNFVGGADFSIMVNSYNKTIGDPGYDPRADFNGDGFVTGADFSLLVNAYNQLGETL